MNRKTIAAFVVIATSFGPAVGLAQDSVVSQLVSGSVYDGEHLFGGTWPTPLYAVRLEVAKGPGIDHLRAVNIDQSGRVFLEQTVDFDGGVPRSFSLSSAALNQTGSLTVTASELVMEFTEKGTTRTAREPRPALFAVGPSVNRLIEQHLASITAGKPLEFRMVVVNRLQTYGFRVSREVERANEELAEVRSGEWVRLRLEPSSGVARLFAPKILLIVDAKSGRTLFLSAPLPSPDPHIGTLKRGTIRYDVAR